MNLLLEVLWYYPTVLRQSYGKHGLRGTIVAALLGWLYLPIAISIQRSFEEWNPAEEMEQIKSELD